jgi:hypothetical protein
LGVVFKDVLLNLTTKTGPNYVQVIIIRNGEGAAMGKITVMNTQSPDRAASPHLSHTE